MPAMLDAQIRNIKRNLTPIIKKWLKNKEKIKKNEQRVTTVLVNGDRSKSSRYKRIVDFRDNAQKNYNKRI
jgi:hypothetical protein